MLFMGTRKQPRPKIRRNPLKNFDSEKKMKGFRPVSRRCSSFHVVSNASGLGISKTGDVPDNRTSPPNAPNIDRKRRSFWRLRP